MEQGFLSAVHTFIPNPNIDLNINLNVNLNFNLITLILHLP